MSMRGVRLVFHFVLFLFVRQDPEDGWFKQIADVTRLMRTSYTESGSTEIQ